MHRRPPWRTDSPNLDEGKTFTKSGVSSESVESSLMFGVPFNQTTSIGLKAVIAVAGFVIVGVVVNKSVQILNFKICHQFFEIVNWRRFRLRFTANKPLR